MAKAVVRIPVVVDNREKREWEFAPEFFTTERATLRTGDYTVRGLEDVLCLERKNLGDAVQTFIHDWTRFRKALYRLAAFDCAAIIVEADISDVLEHRYESEASPQSVIGRAHSIFLDHGLPVLWWGRKANCKVMVESFLIQAVKKLGGVPC